jgi:hypothetical protein
MWETYLQPRSLDEALAAPRARAESKQILCTGGVPAGTAGFQPATDEAGWKPAVPVSCCKQTPWIRR